MTDARFPAHPERISISQGRNDVRDARADVTDMRAPSRTQNVRRKNRAFDLDEGEPGAPSTPPTTRDDARPATQPHAVA